MKQILFVLALAMGVGARAETLSYIQNGVQTGVNVNTVTPANSTPYPVRVLNTSGVPVSLATEATLASIDGKLNSLGQKSMANSVPVALASDQSAIPVSQNGTWNINNISGTISLPTGAATAAKQDTGNTSLASIDTTATAISGKLPSTLGQKTSANSLAVVVASDQSAIPASQSGTWNITNISGTVSLPTGASTAANQVTGNSSLSSIDGKLAADFGASSGAIRTASQIGNATGAAAFNAGNASAQTLRVVVASDQAAVATKAPVNSAGSYAEITNLTTSAQTFTAPANAVGFVIEALSDNSANVRYKVGAAATTTSGMRLEPGRSENFNQGPAANISVIAESGTNQVVTVQWILSQ